MVEYRDQQCDARLTSQSLSVQAPVLSRGLDIMESAANAEPQYMFTAQYFGADLGYFITTINGTSQSVYQANSSEPFCYWAVYIAFPNDTEVQSALGISNFCLPSSGYTIIYRYTSTNENETSVS